MFTQDRLHQEARSELDVAAGCVGMAASGEAVTVEHVNICDYNYLSYSDGAAAQDASAANAQYVLGGEALGSATEMQAELAENPNPSVDNHVEVVCSVDDSKDHEWSSVDDSTNMQYNVSKDHEWSSVDDSTNMQYNVSNVVMVSMDTDNHPTVLEDRNGLAVAADAAEATRNKNGSDDDLTDNMNTTQSSTSAGTETKGYYCSKCKKSFEMKRQFLNHLQFHFKSKDFECTECGERFYQRHCLELHRVTHLDVRKNKPVVNKQLRFECKSCRMRFSSLCRLKSHISLLHKHKNQNVNLHQDSSVSQVTTTQPEIGHHICYHCQKTFKNRKIFSKHIKIHSLNFECIACPKGFDSKEELKIHSWTHFSFYSCSVCDSMFKSSRELARHEGICLSHLLSNKDVVDIVGSEKLFVCDVCSDVFMRKHEFQKHLQLHVKQFRCRQCGSGYHSQAALDSHEKFHEFNSHMYKCSECPKSFYSLPLLQNHQKKHTIESKQCSICKEVFVSEEQRQKHKHLFLGNIKCDLCSIQCSGSHGLNMHKRLAHPEARDLLLYPRVAKKNSEQFIVCIGDDVQ